MGDPSLKKRIGGFFKKKTMRSYLGEHKVDSRMPDVRQRPQPPVPPQEGGLRREQQAEGDEGEPRAVPVREAPQLEQPLGRGDAGVRRVRGGAAAEHHLHVSLKKQEQTLFKGSAAGFDKVLVVHQLA